MHTRCKKRSIVRADDKGSHREAVSQSLGQAYGIWHNAEIFIGKIVSAAPHAGLHLV